MIQNKIHDLKSLLAEKERLRVSLQITEQQLIDRTAYLQNNYKSIIWESINPFKGKSAVSQIANLIINEVLPIIFSGQSIENKIEGKEVVFDLLKKGIGFVKKIGKKKKKAKKSEE
jgi:hypothetical protein